MGQIQLRIKHKNTSSLSFQNKNSYIKAVTGSPNEHTLVLGHPPHGHIHLIGDGVDVGGHLPELFLCVTRHHLMAVNPINDLVGIHCC